MIAFRKHAPESTRRPNSLLVRRTRDAKKLPHIAALIIFLLVASANAFAATQQAGRAKARGQGPAAAAEAPQTHAPKESAQTEETGEDSKIPIRVTRVNTPDGPSVLATIGDFPSDLKGEGQEFLKREFFEHFASDVLGLGDTDSHATDSDSHATLKVALLPQEKENQREGDFTFGKVSGHMVVLVEKRRVLVACTFSEEEERPRLLALVERFVGGGVAAL